MFSLSLTLELLARMTFCHLTIVMMFSLKMFGLSSVYLGDMPVNARIRFLLPGPTAGNHRGHDEVPPGCQLLGKVCAATSYMSSKC